MRLEPPQQRDSIAGLPLQSPITVQPLHELTLSLKGQAVGDLTKPAGEEEWGQVGDVINASVVRTPPTVEKGCCSAAGQGQ